MSGPRERPAPLPGRRLRLSLKKTRSLLHGDPEPGAAAFAPAMVALFDRLFSLPGAGLGA